MSRVLIVGQLDRFANGVKPVEMTRFLRARGHEVTLVDSYYLSRASDRPGSVGRRLPGRSGAQVSLYAIEAVALAARRWKHVDRRLTLYTYLANLKLRRSILRAAFALDEFDIVICEHPFDSGLLTAPTTALTLYDCPTPYADELFFEGRLTGNQHVELRRREAAVFEGVDHLAFHWHSYAEYVVQRYGISGSNLLTLDFGCTPAAERAQFHDPPRIVYLGSLGSRYIDLPLLSRLAALYPDIDVFGGPPPDPGLGLRYRGATDSSVLAGYQLGLVTCTKDELRRHGFSAKHLDYLAHGLPTLVPAWRESASSLRGSIAYTEDTFVSVVRSMCDRGRWSRASQEAYSQAEELTWERTLAPLDALLAPDPTT
jgi:hypothetical protein